MASLVTPYYVINSCQHWFRQWLGTEHAPGHCLKQCWLSVKQTSISNRNTIMFSQENEKKKSSAKCRPFFSGINALNREYSSQGRNKCQHCPNTCLLLTNTGHLSTFSLKKKYELMNLSTVPYKPRSKNTHFNTIKNIVPAQNVSMMVLSVLKCFVK